MVQKMEMSGLYSWLEYLYVFGVDCYVCLEYKGIKSLFINVLGPLDLLCLHLKKQKIIMD